MLAIGIGFPVWLAILSSFVILSGAAQFAMVGLISADPEVARIRHVNVAPEMRGVGVGRALVLAMVEHARLAYRRVRLRTVRARGICLLLALGFKSTPSEADATHGWRL